MVSPETLSSTAEALTAQRFVYVGFLWLIPLFPILGAAINAFFGHAIQARLGKKACSHVAIGAMGLSFAVALLAFVRMIGLPEDERFLLDPLWNIVTAGHLTIDLSFALDPLSMMMVLIITFIGTLIHVYSTGYMADEPAYWRFFCYLNLFVFSMLILVMADNFALMFFGWEGVGLCSYLLIGFWYEDIEKARAAVKAFVTNRFGDFGFVLGLFLLFWALGGAWEKTNRGVDYQLDRELAAVRPPATLEESQRGIGAPRTKGAVKLGPTMSFRELRDQIGVEQSGVKEHLLSMQVAGIPVLALIGILLFIGATAKSAQIPLYVWLPDAMAGPTPVSALIHAATMVTAGVYMVARLNFLFALSTTALTVIAVTGAATAAFAATIGFVQNDIKKVLAYSTVSQLGFMFIGVGVGAFWAGAYHLLTHAFFKACLFLGSGSVILGCHHEQDMRRMGGLKKYMPLTEKTYRYACIAIAGFPIANGFFSKDEILWRAFDSGHNLASPILGKAIWVVGWLAACGTSFYMWRSYYLTFTGEYRGQHPAPAPAVQASGAVSIVHAADVATRTIHAPSGPADATHGSDDHAKSAPHADHPDHKAEGGHGHGGLPHESPSSMTYVLVALAAGCLLTVVLGFWGPLGHLLHIGWMEEPLLERWLSPVLAASSGLVESRAAHSGAFWEWGLMVASVAVAFAGWLIAKALYQDAKSPFPAKVAHAVPRLHRLLFNKYYVDELYQATILRGAFVLAQAFSAFDRVVIDGIVEGTATVARFLCDVEGAIDRYLVDGAVNALAGGVVRAGRGVRRIQSGRIGQYLYVALAGVLLVIGINFLLR